MKNLLLISLLSITSFFTFGQTDTKFWFAVPEVTDLHADQPVKLHISSFDTPTKVTVSVPANGNITPLVFNLNANETRSIDLIDEFASLELLENFTPNTIENKGLLIESNDLITAYYEVLGTSTYGIVNTDIFTLKGSNALGQEFYTPFQTTFNNYPFGKTPDAWSSIDIVATEDNTTISITPTTAVYNTPQNIAANTTITITLNKGQTYSVRNASQLATNSLSGTHLTSDKPIAVTTKDDSVLDQSGTSYDLIGDQLIPVRLLGTEYITGGGDLHIVATTDLTTIQLSYINNNNTTVVIDTTINQGQTFSSLNPNDKPANNPFQISSSQPIAVFLLKKLGLEYGGAIIPTIECTGSRLVSISNTARETLIIEIITKPQHANNFTLNGIPFTLSNTSTLGGYLYAYQAIDPNNYPLNEPLIFKNTSGAFHLGIINGGQTTGLRYGYFSNFGILELGSDRTICQGEEATLDAGNGRDTYEWSQIGNPTFSSDQQTIKVNQTGEYILKVTEGICQATDTVTVIVNPNISPIDLGTTTQFCENDSVILSAPLDATTSLWQDNSTNNTFVVKETGIYSLIAANQFGCTDSASISITQYDYPKVEIAPSISICENTNYTINLTEGYDTYKWYNENVLINENTPNYSFDTEGNYSVAVSNFCGSDSAAFNLKFWHIEIPNVITPNGDGKNDQFIIKGIEDGDWDLTVYNRWGKSIYRNNNFKNDWTTSEQDGTYYFYLKNDDECNEFKGWLYIVR